MSTRSILAVQTGDSWKGRYCHGDGYPSWQLRRLLELVQRDGLTLVRTTLVDMYAGWSHLDSNRLDISGVQFDPEASYETYEYGSAQYEAWQLNRTYGERVINVPGYGVAYSTKTIAFGGRSDYQQIEEDDWRGPTDVDDCEWAYVLADHDILIFRPASDESWKLAGRMGYDSAPTDDEVRVIECGQDYEFCGHYAWAHFGAAKTIESRVGTGVWLGHDQPGSRDIHELIDNRTGTKLVLAGGGGQGSATDPNYRQHGDLYALRNRYWWCSVKGGPDVRAFRLLKEGMKLEPRYDAVVTTGAGDIVIPAGTVLDR